MATLNTLKVMKLGDGKMEELEWIARLKLKKLKWHKNGTYYIAGGLRISYEIIEKSKNQYVLYVDYGDESVHVNIIFSSLEDSQQYAQKDHDMELMDWIEV